MISTEETKQMANDVLAYIEAHPESHDQRFFILNPQENGCGTTMCVAGTAAWLKYGKGVDDVSVEFEARRLLGLSQGEADVLFYEMSNERALAKLQKVALGEPFTVEDYERYDDATDSEPFMDLNAWDARDIYHD